MPTPYIPAAKSKDDGVSVCWLRRHYGSLLGASLGLAAAVALALGAAEVTPYHAGLATALAALAMGSLAFAASRLPIARFAALRSLDSLPAVHGIPLVEGGADPQPGARKEAALREALEQRTRMLQSTNHDLEERVRELNILFSASKALGSSLERTELLRAFGEATFSLLHVDRCLILVPDSRRGSLVVTETMGFDPKSLDLKGTLVPAGSCPENEAFLRRKTILIPDLVADPRPLLIKERCAVQGAVLLIPLLAGGHTVGVWVLQRNPPHGFSFDDSGIFHTIANQLATALENARLYQMTRELATHDELTGLYNRRTLDSRIEMEWERSRRFGSWLGLIMVDVDCFKAFNDTHGHLVGDQVLRHVGTLLQSHVRKVDMVSRFGGEEFCILLPRASLEEARTVAEHLRQQVEATPLATDQGTYHVTASFGAASSEVPATDIRSLLDLADQALYRAKAEGRNRVACAQSADPLSSSPDHSANPPISRGAHVDS